MDSHDLSQVWAIAGVVGEVGVCVLALIRGLWRRLPWFTAYLLLVLAVEAARWAVIIGRGADSPAHSWAYWTTQPLLILGRGAALADVCRATLCLYTGIWQLARYLLSAAAVLMLSVAAVHTGGTPGIVSYLIFVERELEFAILVTLVVLLILSRYYGVALDRPLDSISLGLAFYSSVVIINSSILIGALALPWRAFSTVRTMGWDVTLGFWVYALRAPLSAQTQPHMNSAESYERDARVVSGRMRALNARLLDLMKR